MLAVTTYANHTGRLDGVSRGPGIWGAGAVAQADYAWEDDGDLDTQSVRYTETGAAVHAFDYAYDASAKLVSETRPATWRWSAVAEETIAYDPANALDQYTSVDSLALTYDTNGNRTSYDGLATLHDAENRLVAATTSTMSVIYRYDAAGRRVMKDFISGAYADTAFLHAGDMEIAEYDASGTLLRRFIPGLGTDDRIAMIEVGAGCGASASSCSETSRAYYVADRIGHVIATFDASGDLIDSYRYTPFGVHDDGTPQAGQPFRYTGRRLDPETGLYFYRARYYDQQHGRFLETDPVGYEDQMNLYAYVGNDPLNGTDPTGMFENDENFRFTISAAGEVELVVLPGDAGPSPEGSAEGGAAGLFVNFDFNNPDGPLLTVGTFTQIKQSGGIDAGISVSGNYTQGGVDDFAGDAITVEVDRGGSLVGTLEAGRTESGKFTGGVEGGFGLPAGISENLVSTTIRQSTTIDTRAVPRAIKSIPARMRGIPARVRERALRDNTPQ